MQFIRKYFFLKRERTKHKHEEQQQLGHTLFIGAIKKNLHNRQIIKLQLMNKTIKHYILYNIQDIILFLKHKDVNLC